MPFCPACGIKTNSSSCAACETSPPSVSPQRPTEARVPVATVGTVAVLAVAGLWVVGQASASHSFDAASGEATAPDARRYQLLKQERRDAGYARAFGSERLKHRSARVL